MLSHVRKRCSAHYLHALIQPQIRGLEVQAGTIHHALGLLQQRCPGLETFSLTGSTSANPELFIPVFKHFPNLTKIDLSGNIMDDRAFDSIGQVCHRYNMQYLNQLKTKLWFRLRYLNVTRSTISDTGLKFLSRSSQNVPRCQDLQVRILSMMITGHCL